MKALPISAMSRLLGHGKVLAVTLAAGTVAHADLVNRWSFNESAGNAPDGTAIVDSVGGVTATVVGQYVQQASFTGTGLRLPGTSNGNHSLGFMSAFVDLPDGIISSKTNLTVEIWAAPMSAGGGNGYSRLFSFGRTNVTHGPGADPGELVAATGRGQTPGATAGEDALYYSFAVATDANAQRMDAFINNTGSQFFDAGSNTAFGTTYHYVFTFEDGVGTFGSNGGRASWYRDNVLLHSADVNFHLSAVEDVNCWLGHSQWSNDWNADAEYKEVRIWNHALGTAEIAQNFLNGPDSLVDSDTDDDGLADTFEDQYFGNNDGTATPAELAVTGGSDDPDNDGLTNAQEQQRGTDPTDPLSPPPPPAPDHLWTFTEQANSTAESGMVFTDEIGGNWMATLVGQGGALDGRQVILPGSTTGNETVSSISAYLDLSNGIVSDSASVTFEAWATPLSSKNWARLFDFGRTVTTSGPGAATGEIVDTTTTPGLTSAWDNLSLTFNNAGNINSQQLEGEYDDNGAVFSFSNAATTVGTEYHYALVVEDGVGAFGSNGIRASWYRDGVLQNSDDFNFRLVDMEDVNNWIGRSMYTGDSNSHLALNELRIYRRALAPTEIEASYLAGADPSSGPPEPPAPAPVPQLLWDFNTASGGAGEGTIFTDASSQGTLVVHGNGATLDGDQLVLPGGTNGGATAANISAYLELPNGFISAYSDLTIEGWMTPLSSETWQRVWDFGNCTVTHGTGAAPGEIIDDGTSPAGFAANDNLFLSLNNGGALGSHRLGGKLDAGGETTVDTDLSGTTSTGTEYHFVMTVEDGSGSSGATGCRVKWYRDSVLYGSMDLPFRLRDLEDVNNWIGRSNWSGDMNSHMAINELRVYDRAITQQEVNTTFANGANATFSPPVANDDAATLHEGMKVLVDVTANDTDGPQAATVAIVTQPTHGTAVVNPDGKILYTHAGGSTAPDSFTYTVDNFSGTSEPATVEITIATSLRIDNPAWTMQTAPPVPTWSLVEAMPGLTFTRPICLTTVPGDTKQIYVCEQNGLIKRVADITATNPVANDFLDISALGTGFNVGPLLAGYPENGLLGLAFHPDYATNGYFFVAYTINQGGNYFQRVSRFTRSAGDATVADPGSELVMLQIDDFGLNHNGGDLHFGPFDGYLYYGTGDGENSTSGQARSQLINDDFYSGIFRLDVDKKPGNLEPNPHASIPTYNNLAAFSVPVDNPFVHSSLGGDWDGSYNGVDYSGDLATVRTEFWATGIRHAWRMSFDPETGDLWEGDVGQVSYEEINRIQRGGNYGWAYREGAHDFTGIKGAAPNGFTSIDPVYDYAHTALAGDSNYKGNSVCGGWVYRGTKYPSLTGSYIFCDSTSGHVWKMNTTSGAVERITGLPGAYGVFSSMGVDPANKDVLFCAYLDGKIMRIAPGGEVTTGFPQTLSETGLFADLTDLTPAPGLLPYTPNLRFWSDHADKTRWFGIPDGTSQMTWSEEGRWDYPAGTVWVKHFDLAMERGNPATNKRIETRVIVKTETGAYGVTYRWNEEETEAYLTPEAGEQFPLAIDEAGSAHTQTWELPSRVGCQTCHQGGPLSFTTRQLNLAQTVNGFSGNLIDQLSTGGYLANSVPATSTLPFHVRPDETQYPLEQRVRSYLDVNCAYCHQAGGSVPGFWDGREALSLEQTGLVNAAPVVNGGDSLNRYVTPLDTAHSILLHRVAATPPFTRMPPLGTYELDEEAIQLLTDWINSGLPADRLYVDWAGPDGYNLTGSRTDDDDGDGRTNYEEFLLGTNPLLADSDGLLTMGPDSVSLSRKAFRNSLIETSVDMVNWEIWDAPGNALGFDESDRIDEFPVDTAGANERFFRVRVSEP